MFKLILINSFNLILLISYCHSMPQSDQISLMGNHNHQFHQPNHFSTQLHSRSSNQNDILRSSRLMPSASSPKSSIINTRTNQEIRPQFNQNQNNFKPIINRPPQPRASQSNNQKRLKQQHKNHHQHIQSKISWGRCPMLQPSLEEKMKKAQVISKCLEITPVPENITRETIELHRELVAACALKEEGWFTSALTSDDDIKLININKTITETLNATTTIDELIKNGTLKTNSLDNNSTMASVETNLSPVYLHSKDTTKLDNLDNKLVTLLSANNNTNTSSILSKNDQKLNNQTSPIETNQKHSALESDEYSEDDYSSIFTGALTYNYSKAEHEIRSKKFDKEIEEKVIEFHENCKEEAQDKYNNPIQIIAQIQLYQACMDYHISNICGIEIIY